MAPTMLKPAKTQEVRHGDQATAVVTRCREVSAAMACSRHTEVQIAVGFTALLEAGLSLMRSIGVGEVGGAADQLAGWGDRIQAVVESLAAWPGPCQLG